MKRRLRSRKTRRTLTSSSPKRADDSSGDLLIIFAILWYFGFITVNWGGSDDAVQKLVEADKQFQTLQVTLKEYESKIEHLQVSFGQTEDELGSLDLRKEAIEKQIKELQAVRDKVTTDLSTISNIMEHDDKPDIVWPFLQNFMSSVFANLVTPFILVAAAFVAGKRYGGKGQSNHDIET